MLPIPLLLIGAGLILFVSEKVKKNLEFKKVLTTDEIETINIETQAKTVPDNDDAIIDKANIDSDGGDGAGGVNT